MCSQGIRANLGCGRSCLNHGEASILRRLDHPRKIYKGSFYETRLDAEEMWGLNVGKLGE